MSRQVDPAPMQPAYVLHARPYRETSLLLEVFTRDHGRIGMVARGVRGARGQALRVVLQPLQPLLLSWSGRGELMRLSVAEPAGAALTLSGHGLLAAFYLNELVLRLLPRGEAQTELFWRYAQCLGQLADDTASQAWELRRFERDLLAAAGYALELDAEADGGGALDPEARYRFDPLSGPQRVREGTGAAGSVSGAALLALGEDRKPDAPALRELRRLMREVLRHHLGGRELRSWQVLADLAAGARAARNPDDA